MNSIEQQNVIELLKQALYFYADEKNYKKNQSVNHELFSMIEMDSGMQAKFALKKLEEIDDVSKSLEENLIKEITESIENSEEIANVIDIIKQYKNRVERQ